LSEENLPEKIIKLGKVLNVNIANNDINICHKVATRRSSGDPRPIIVRFRSYRAKSELYKARKHLKSASLSNYFHNTEAVYINENLTDYTDPICLLKSERLKRTTTGIAPGPWIAKFSSKSPKVIR